MYHMHYTKIDLFVYTLLQVTAIDFLQRNILDL